MKLNEDQLKSVAVWFAGGASLDEIQKRLVAEFGVHLTYFDLRLIVAELPQPEEKENAVETPATPNEDESAAPNDGEPATPNEDEVASANDGAGSGASDGGAATAGEAAPDGGAASTLSVTVDALMIPGTMASGDVTFSDGVKGKWYLDQMGRLGLGGDLPQGYRPSPADAALFQARLMEALRAKGLY